MDCNLRESNSAKEIIDFLAGENKSIAIVESCTGGLINYTFSQISGASSVFRGGIVSYQNEVKINVLGIDERILAQKSAYSVEVVDLMLKQICEIMNSNFAIATSGIAGPNGGSVEMPVGSVFVGVKQRAQKSIIKKEIFSGNRTAIQSQATQFALDLFKKSFISHTNYDAKC